MFQTRPGVSVVVIASLSHLPGFRDSCQPNASGWRMGTVCSAVWPGVLGEIPDLGHQEVVSPHPKSTAAELELPKSDQALQQPA